MIRSWSLVVIIHDFVASFSFQGNCWWKSEKSQTLYLYNLDRGMNNEGTCAIIILMLRVYVLFVDCIMNSTVGLWLFMFLFVGTTFFPLWWWYGIICSPVFVLELYIESRKKSVRIRFFWRRVRNTDRGYCIACLHFTWMDVYWERWRFFSKIAIWVQIVL